MGQEIQNQAPGTDSAAGLAALLADQDTSPASPAQPTEGTEANGNGTQAAQPTYITTAEAQKIFDEQWKAREADIIDKAKRTAQSITDSAVARSNQLQKAALDGVNAQIQAIVAAGGTVPEQVAAKMREDAVNKAVTAEAPTEQQAATAQPQQPQQPATQQQPPKPASQSVEVPEFLDRKASQLEAQFGVTLTREDPEFAGLDLSKMKSDPFSFAVDYEAQLKAKAERMKTHMASVPTIAANGGPSDPRAAWANKSPYDKLDMGYQK